MINKNKSMLGLGKYRSIALYITIFVILISGLLILNLTISNQLQKNAREINIAATQASLVQGISKDIYTMISQYQKVLPYDNEKNSLKASMERFELTLEAFLGNYQGKGEGFDLPQKMNNPEGITLLNQSKSIWEGYQNNIEPIFSQEKNSQSDFLSALAYSDKYNQELTGLMNQLSGIIQEDSRDDVLFLRVIQIIGIALAIFSFIFIIFYLVRYLRRSDYELEAAQEETTEILNTVREGLFLLDSELLIGSQCSKEMEEIFEIDNIAGVEFSALLRNIIPTDKIDTVEDFVKLLFDPDVVEDLIGSLNPLDNIEVKIFDSYGSLKTKYLDFSFYRVVSRDEIKNVLVSVRDMTHQNILKQELESSKAESQNRMLVLDEFLRADNEAVGRFINNTKKTFANINMILKEEVSSVQDFTKRLDRIFVHIHRAKGESTTLGFTQLSDKSHEFETELEKLKNVRNVQGIDFLPLTVKLEELIRSLDILEKISLNIAKHSGKSVTQSGSASTITPNRREEWKHLKQLVTKMSREYQKDVDLIMTGFSEIPLKTGYKDLISNVSIQLIKNALIHGIEEEHERIRSQKNPTGRIDLVLSKLPDGSIEFTMKDDGRGFDLEKIREKLVERAVINTRQAGQLTKDQLVQNAFKTGFSTADQVDINAGRGVGLDVIRNSIVSVGGKLSLKLSDGKSCQFNVLLPAQSA